MHGKEGRVRAGTHVVVSSCVHNAGHRLGGDEVVLTQAFVHSAPTKEAAAQSKIREEQVLTSIASGKSFWRARVAHFCARQLGVLNIAQGFQERDTNSKRLRPKLHGVLPGVFEDSHRTVVGILFCTSLCS